MKSDKSQRILRNRTCYPAVCSIVPRPTPLPVPINPSNRIKNIHLRGRYRNLQTEYSLNNKGVKQGMSELRTVAHTKQFILIRGIPGPQSSLQYGVIFPNSFVITEKLYLLWVFKTMCVGELVCLCVCVCVRAGFHPVHACHSTMRLH
jgi:hypothetical protein